MAGSVAAALGGCANAAPPPASVDQVYLDAAIGAIGQSSGPCRALDDSMQDTALLRQIQARQFQILGATALRDEDGEYRQIVLELPTRDRILAIVYVSAGACSGYSFGLLRE